ncbi:MAG: DNA internalization-related competence protein ComEC/Rec2 [Myxococcaceae bacterium]
MYSRRSGAHLSLLGAVFLVGAFLSTLHARPSVPEALDEGGKVRLEGVVEEVTDLGDSTRVTLAASRAPDLEPPEVRFRVPLYTRDLPAPLLAGQRVMVLAHLKPIEEVSNWGQRDVTGPRRRKAIVFSGGFDAKRLAVLSQPSPGRQWLTRTRQELADRVYGVAPGPDAAALYLTLAAGLRATLGEDLEDAFARSGLAHILSVSGLHVAALALFTLKLLRFAAVRGWRRSRRVDARRLAAPLSIPFVWAYVVFTGSQPPAVRSAVMATVFLAGLSLWRQSDALNGLSLAAIAVIAVDPSCVADLSMQLSFLAVGSLILLAPAIRQALPVPRPDPTTASGARFWGQRAREAALQTFCASLAVTLTGAPLIAAAFHRVSLAGLVSNVVVLPLCAALTALAAGGAAMFVVSPAASTPLLWAGSWASQLLVWAAQLFAAIPGASQPVPAPSPWTAAIYFAGLAMFALGRGRARWAAILAPMAVLSAGAGPLLFPGRGLEVTFLSVGQGDAIVLSSQGAHALIDGGGVQDGADTGERFVLPYLRERGIRRLSLAVLTHPHPDHALGLVSTLEQVPTERLWLGAGTTWGELSELVSTAAGQAPVEEVEAGHPGFALGEASLEVLGPPADRVLLEGVNDRSVVLRVRHGGVTFLLPGDIEEAAEQGLDPGPVTVLKAPHHGSRRSSTQGFVDRVRPRFVVFCVGRRNRFHFPHEESLDRYAAAGSECYRTDLDGAIRFTSDGQDVRVETFRPHPKAPGLRPVALRDDDAQSGER